MQRITKRLLSLAVAVIPDAEDQKSSGYYRGYYETRKKTKDGGEC